MGNKIELDFSKMDDRELLLYLVMRVNNLPERVSELEKFKWTLAGGLAVVSSGTLVSILMQVWK